MELHGFPTFFTFSQDVPDISIIITTSQSLIAKNEL